jgi:23S rRNA (adenine-N6)-dimethyltransferase
MRYKRRRRLYSQNFLYSTELVDKLIRISSIGSKDIVVEIGPGEGIITLPLSKKVKEVIAVEKDRVLYKKLLKIYQYYGNIKLFCTDILNFKMPKKAYKVFSNIPFSVTAVIVRKLVSDPNFLEGFLVVQKEAAKKFIGMPYAYKNSMFSVVLKPEFDISVFWKFKRGDFVPRPAVDAVMMKITRKKTPDIPYSDIRLYKSFVEVLFNRRKVARKPYREILGTFKGFKTSAGYLKKKKVLTYAKKLEKTSTKIEKIKRTRNDRNWRKFKSR